MSFFQQTKEHVFPVPPLRPWEGSKAGREGQGHGAASEKKQQLSRTVPGQGEWGFHGGSHHAPALAQPGEYVCSEMSPCGWAASAGAHVSWRWGSPRAMPLCSPGSTSCRRLHPTTLGGSGVSPVCGTHWAGSSGGVKSWFLAAGGHQQLLCIMESYLCSPKPSCQAVAFFFFFRGLVTQPLCCGRRNQDDISGWVTQQVLRPRRRGGTGLPPP